MECRWKHLQRAGVKNAKKDPESTLRGDPHVFGHAYGQESSQTGHSGPVLLPCRTASVLRRTGLTPEGIWESTKGWVSFTSPPEGGPAGQELPAARCSKETKPQFCFAITPGVAEMLPPVAAAALVRAELPSRMGSVAWGWFHCRLHMSGRWSRSH